MTEMQIRPVPAVSGRRRPTGLLVLAVGLLVPHAVPALAIDITACGVTVDRGQTGVLQADLDCSSQTFGVRLLSRATLDLNGHTIAGGNSTIATVVGVRTVGNPIGVGAGNFKIVGPGEITGTHTNNVDFPGTAGCVLLNNGRARITSATGVVEIAGCVYGVLGSTGVRPDIGRLQMDHVTFHDHSEVGTSVTRLRASDITAYNVHAFGIGASKVVQVTSVMSHDNGIGIFGGDKIRGTDVTTTNNSANGIDTFGRVVMTNLTSTGNGYSGVSAPNGGVNLVDSTVTGNGTSDILSGAMPVLTNTTCGSSIGPTNAPWGVCTND